MDPLQLAETLATFDRTTRRHRDYWTALHTGTLPALWRALGQADLKGREDVAALADELVKISDGLGVRLDTFSNQTNEYLKSIWAELADLTARVVRLEVAAHAVKQG